MNTLNDREVQRLQEILQFSHNYIEVDRFAETLGRALLDLDVEADRVAVLLFSMAVVYANQGAETGRDCEDEDDLADALYDVLSDTISVLPSGLRDRFIRACDSATQLHKAVLGIAGVA